MTASAIFKTLQGKDFKITFGNGNSIYSAFLQITRENKELYRVSDMIAYLDRIKCNPKEKLIPGKVYRLLLKSEEPAYLEQIAQSSEPQVQLPPKSFYLENNLPTIFNITSDNYSSTEALGVYQGAGYSMKGIYRPVPDCRMRTNEAKAFCPVCQISLQRLIDFYTD